ncbi:MAG: DUF2842 domain-containing protein [Pseudomonadota bacterium]
MTYRTRKMLSLVVLVVGLPVYIGLSLYVISLFDRPSIIVELIVYVGLGVLWALPFRGLFRGIGREDPNAPPENQS